MTNTFYCKKQLPVILNVLPDPSKGSNESPQRAPIQPNARLSQSGFITHLLATKLNVSQTRLKRREAPFIAAQIYAAVRDVPLMSAGAKTQIRVL
jgi:hypothetical protein